MLVSAVTLAVVEILHMNDFIRYVLVICLSVSSVCHIVSRMKADKYAAEKKVIADE